LALNTSVILEGRINLGDRVRFLTEAELETFPRAG